MVAIAADPLPAMEGLSKQFPGLVFLADADDLPVSQSFGAARPGDEVPKPATFVLDRTGTVRFAHFGGRGNGEWPAWEELLAALPSS